MAEGREAKRQSVHHRIADDLRAAIRSGEYQDGDRLPGENAIMRRYGVARVTAREALAVLRNEGLAVSRRGSGVYVRLFAPIRRHGSSRLSRERWGSGRDVWATEVQERRPQVDPISVSRIEVPAEMAPALGVEPGATVVLRDRRPRFDVVVQNATGRVEDHDVDLDSPTVRILRRPHWPVPDLIEAGVDSEHQPDTASSTPVGGRGH